MKSALVKLRKTYYSMRKSGFQWQSYYLKNVYLPHEDAQKKIFERVKEQTMIAPAGVMANMDAIDYIAANKIEGAIVECGVWRGGSMMAMILRLMDNGDQSRQCYLFDTFAGMTEPTEHDVKRGGGAAFKKFEESQKDTHNEWCYASLEDVQANIKSTGYPESNVHYIKGDILKTLPEADVPEIAVLRLDTDWYESTKLEMELLYPKVVKGGVVIIDDYGGWEGARLAVDEYFEKQGFKPLMSRVDLTRRFFIKP